MRQTTLEERSAINVLERTGRYRVIRRFDPEVLANRAAGLASPPGEGDLTFAVLDFEATGLDPAVARPFDLAVALFRIRRNGEVLHLGSMSFLEDPGEPIPAEVKKLTGISDEMVRGHRFNEMFIGNTLKQAGVDLLVAHNAKYDRVIFERRFPGLKGMNWGCSLSDIDWGSRFVSSRSLDYLAYRSGWFFEGHRALADVMMLGQLLSSSWPGEERPLVLELVDNAFAPGARLWAAGAPFDAKDRLKERGYRWHPGDERHAKCWYRDIPAAELEAETEWYDERIRREFGAREPEIVMIDASTRHGPDAGFRVPAPLRNLPEPDPAQP